MTEYRETPVSALLKGDVFGLVNEVVRVRRNNRTGFVDVTVNIFDHHGRTISRMTRHYYPDESVMVAVIP